MSTLHESLLARRTNGPSADQLGYSIKAQTPSLRVKCAEGQSWTLPWAHFVFGHLTADEQSEILLLTFASHEVVLKGRNLGPLEEDAANLRLEKLQIIAAKYSISDGEVSIRSIQVRSLNQSRKTSAAESRSQDLPPGLKPSAAREEALAGEPSEVAVPIVKF